MADGATMSTPASACADGGLGKKVQRPVVVHDAVFQQDATVPVRCVLAHADIADDREFRLSLLDDPDRLLHDAVRRIALRPNFVLVRGNAEHKHGGDPHFCDGSHLRLETVE